MSIKSATCKKIETKEEENNFEILFGEIDREIEQGNDVVVSEGSPSGRLIT